MASAPVDTTQRLAALRELLQKGTEGNENVDAMMVPHEDSHMSEYAASHFERLEFISGFSGSAGSALVTKDHAYLWTDGRYHLQAATQLDANWTLMKAGLVGVKTMEELLKETLPEIKRIGLDPYCMSYESYNKVQEELEATNQKLVPLWTNPLDKVWIGRPSLPKDKIVVHPIEFTGMTWHDKVETVRMKMKEKKCDVLIGSCLDDIAWLFNVRGSDVEFNPTFYAYAMITLDSLTLYVEGDKVDDEVRAHLDGVAIKPYKDILTDMKDKAPSLTKLWVGNKCNYALASQVPKPKVLVEITPMTKLKAVKNDAELEGARNCQIRDGVALASYLCWLADQVKEGRSLDEVDGADQLLKFRAEQKLFVTPSFATISSMGPNGAIIHYSPSKPTAAPITADSLYLLDSGAQFLYATVAPNESHIGLARCVFPTGVTGHRIDLLAREHLWKYGLDYMHGTGHGVGAYLNVHEGPHMITPRSGVMGDYPLEPGMIISNEPGYYEANNFGIRIESLVVVKKIQTEHQFNNIQFLGFETTTMVPLASNLLDLDLLTKDEIDWINDYHREVREKVGAMLKEQ
eukprot:Ihof_evm2s579 gene=Ihof_evmTU2s579